MSYTQEITLWCDNCSKWEMFNTASVRKARQQARKQGWRYQKNMDWHGQQRGQDLCPDCAAGKPPETKPKPTIHLVKG